MRTEFESFESCGEKNLDKIEHKELGSGINLLIFRTQVELCSTFLRFAEYYESPEFRGKIFTLDEFKQWYIKNNYFGKATGLFSYYYDWMGFNIPSHVLQPFVSGKFDPLSDQEKRFLSFFINMKDPFYIIGISSDTPKDEQHKMLMHEIAHGLFFVNDNYRNEVLRALSCSNVDPIRKEVIAKGYNESVLEDEINAYILYLKHHLETPVPKNLSRELKKLFDKYIEKSNIRVY